MENHTLSLVTLAEDRDVGVLKGGEFLLVALTLALKLLSNFLLKNQGLESIVTLLLSTRQTDSEAGCIVLLLVDEA